MASIHSNGVLVEDSPPFFLLSARPTNTNWRDSIRIGGESPRPQRGFIGPRCGVVRQRAASLDLLHVRLIAGSTLAPTDRSNGSLWEMMLLLCFRGLHHHLHPCKHAPPFFFLRHTAAHYRPVLCRNSVVLSINATSHPFPLNLQMFFIQIHPFFKFLSRVLSSTFLFRPICSLHSA